LDKLPSEEPSKAFSEADVNGDGEVSGFELQSLLACVLPIPPKVEFDSEAMVKRYSGGKTALNETNFEQFWLKAVAPLANKGKKTALLVIDVQNDFISGSLPVPKAEGVVSVINR